jgi:hypothetical protein
MDFWNSFTLKIVSLIVVFAFMYITGFLSTKYQVLKKTNNNLRFASPLDKSLHLFLMLLTTLYTYVLSSIFSAFRCYPQDDETFTLLSSPALDCYDSVWYKNLWIIVIGVLILCAVPTSLFLILRRNRNRRMDNQFYWRFGRLIDPYKPAFYYWEVVLMIRRTIFVSLVDLTNSWQKFDRSFVLIVFLLAELLLEVLVQPYSKEKNFTVEIRVM